MIKEHKKMTKSTRIFVAILVAVVVLIIGLIVGNIIVKVNNDKKNDETSQQGQNENNLKPDDNKNDDEKEYVDIETAPISKDNYKEKITIEIADMEDQKDIAALIAIYQKYIDAFNGEVKDEEIVEELYNEKIVAILKLDLDKEYGDEVIADAIKLDDMLQTISSATQVYNYASSYEQQDIMDKYEKILDDRTAEAGVDIDDSEIVNIKVSSKTPLKNDVDENE